MNAVKLISFLFLKICEHFRLEKLKNNNLFSFSACIASTQLDEMIKNNLM